MKISINRTRARQHVRQHVRQRIRQRAQQRVRQRTLQRGVSLVELLIVLSIAAMVAGIVIINAPPGRSNIRSAADTFAARLDFAAQDAITRGVLIGMTLDENGYAFFTYNRGQWSALENKRISGENFSPDYTVAVKMMQMAKKNEVIESKRDSEAGIRPNVIFSPTGEATEFSVSFRDKSEAFRVTLGNSGHVEVNPDERAQ